MTTPILDPDNDRMMTVEEVATFFSVTKHTVRAEWIKNGQLKATKLNGQWRILKSEVIRFAKELYE